MAKLTNQGNKGNKPQTFMPTVHAGGKSINITVAFTYETSARIRKARKELGLLSDPEIIRAAVAAFLTKNGY